MENFAADELYVLRDDGTVELSSAPDASPRSPAWLPHARAAIEGQDRSRVVVDELGVSLQAWRLAEVGGERDDGGKILVLVRRRPPWMRQGSLTKRQREISEYAAGGATVGEIARHLEISLHTVRSHLKAVYRQLGVCNRVELARALGLLPA